MDQFGYFGKTAAGILLIAPADHPTIWSWFLLAAVMALCIRLREQSQLKLKSIPVLSHTRRVARRTHLDVRR